MRRISAVILCIGVVTIFSTSIFAAGDSNKTSYAGMVVNDQNQLIEGAKVTCYQIEYERLKYTSNILKKEEVLTKGDGKFSFTVENVKKESGRNVQTIITAEKDGFAIDQSYIYSKKDQQQALKMTLDKPAVLAGVVVNESNEPVADAEVQVVAMLIKGDDSSHDRYIRSIEPIDILVIKTDNQGKFSFNNIPEKATAEFMVKKPGRAIISTMAKQGSRDRKLHFAAGQKDIRLVQPAGGKIEGKVLEKGSGKIVAGVSIWLMEEMMSPSRGTKPITSAADGTFTFNDIAAGNYSIGLTPNTEGVSDWTGEPAKATVETGKTASGITLQLSKGGLLEVIITDADKKPVEGASISIRSSEEGRRWANSRSDKTGKAIVRLMPGEYSLSGIYKEGYSTPRQEETFTIEDGKTSHLEKQLTSQPKINGIVRDATGKAIEGVSIRILPGGSRSDAKTDAQGKFEISWNPEYWGGPEGTSYFLVARQESLNLAAAVEITEETKTLDVKLSPGLIFAGKVVDPNGKPIGGAEVMTMMRASRWGSNIGNSVKTGSDGKYEIKAIPTESKYSMNIQADGYGSESIQQDQLAEAATNSRIELPATILQLANLSVSGIVVDSNDVPVADVRLNVYGEGQPNKHDIRTDKQGKFKIDGVCAGPINISANVEGKSMYGQTHTEGGATDARIMVSERGTRRGFSPRQSLSLIGKPLPDVNSVGIKVDPNGIKDKMVLLCFVDLNQRPSRHCFNELVQKHNELTQKGVYFAAVQVGNADMDLKHAFPLGQIANDEKTKSSWGVKALPWLILTDSKHTIAAEGFALSELDEKLKIVTTK